MNALTILQALDARLTTEVDLTLYGRAAIQLGFATPPADALLSLDVDAILWEGQAERLLQAGNFWEAIDGANQALAPTGLYISHLFTEDQVILRPDWRARRQAIGIAFSMLRVFRLADMDLLLSKLMRADPQDLQDALFIARAAGLTAGQIQEGLAAARVPAIPEVTEQFQQATQHFWAAWELEPAAGSLAKSAPAH